jgi:hypothetical protein
MKDFSKQIQALRDEMHKEIIKELVLRTSNEEDYELELNQPFYTWVDDWDNNYKVQVVVTGITGDDFQLLTRCVVDGEVSEDINYQDLGFAELNHLYKEIVTNSFTIKVY